MKFREIEFLTIPKMLFAFSVEVENYNNSFINRENYLEISLIESGRTCVSYPDRTEEIFREGVIFPIFQDTNYRVRTLENELQKHSTVAVSANYVSKTYNGATKAEFDTLTQKMQNKSAVVLVPDREEVFENFSVFQRLLNKMSYYNSSNLPSDKSRALSAFFEFCSELSSCVLNEISNCECRVSPGAQRYVDYTKQYVHRHHAEKIRVDDIAAKLNISAGYLQAVFKVATGMGIAQYCNKYRVNIALQYIDKYGFSLKNAAAKVGICDEYYMSKIFKKEVGISYKEYIKQKKEHIKNNM